MNQLRFDNMKNLKEVIQEVMHKHRLRPAWDSLQILVDALAKENEWFVIEEIGAAIGKNENVNYSAFIRPGLKALEICEI